MPWAWFTKEPPDPPKVETKAGFFISRQVGQKKTRVCAPGRASRLQPETRGFDSFRACCRCNGAWGRWSSRILGVDEAAGSTPVAPTEISTPV